MQNRMREKLIHVSCSCSISFCIVSLVYLLEPDIDLKKEAVVMDAGYIFFYSAVCNDVFGWS